MREHYKRSENNANKNSPGENTKFVGLPSHVRANYKFKLREIFNLLDSDGTGTLEISEFLQFFKAVGASFFFFHFCSGLVLCCWLFGYISSIFVCKIVIFLGVVSVLRVFLHYWSRFGKK